jgi:hypothetical protein
VTSEVGRTNESAAATVTLSHHKVVTGLFSFYGPITPVFGIGTTASAAPSRLTTTKLSSIVLKWCKLTPSISELHYI